MADFISTYFGPLDKSSCIYFLIISVLSFMVLIILAVFVIFTTIKNLNNFDFKMTVNLVLILFNIFLAYFVNRLLYTMCTKSLA